MSLVVHFDGLCEPNPGGVATYGFTVDRDGRRVHEDCGLAGRPNSPDATNNVAEYTGVLRALEWLTAQGWNQEPTLVRGDSDLVIRQLKGEWKVKSALLAPLHARARDLARGFPSLKFEWVRREQNRDADALTNRAYAMFKRGGRPEPVTEWMKVEISFQAATEAVEQGLRGLGITAQVAPEPGGSRVTAQIQADPEALRRLLDLKQRLEMA